MKSHNPRFLFSAAISVAVLFFSTGCITVNEPDRTPYPAVASENARPVVTDYQAGRSDLAARPAEESWDAILKRRSRIQFQILHTGRVKVPRSGMLNLAHEKLNGQADSEIWVDVFAYHFCHTTRGCFLIDSGLDDSFRTGQGGNVTGLLASSYIIATEQNEGQDIAALLKTRTHPAQQPLQGVFFTHLHGDHTSGVPALPKDIRYIAGKDEKYINYFLLYYSDHLAGVKKLEEINFANTPLRAPLGRVVDLFGDGSFWAISTPGHSNSHVAYLLVTDSGPVLLTGDASHTRWGFENGVEPGWTDNREQTRQSLEQLRTFARAYPNVRVIFGHEL